jgi:hypothetical protein
MFFTVKLFFQILKRIRSRIFVYFKLTSNKQTINKGADLKY